MKKLLLILLLASCQHLADTPKHIWMQQEFTSTLSGEEVNKDQEAIEAYYQDKYNEWIALSQADKQPLTFAWVNYGNRYTLTIWLPGSSEINARVHTVDPPKLPKPPPPSMR